MMGHVVLVVEGEVLGFGFVEGGGRWRGGKGEAEGEGGGVVKVMRTVMIRIKVGDSGIWDWEMRDMSEMG